jgi:cytidylate kinase
MMGERNIIITIGREYGSGGHEIGEKLAKKLGINFYDNKLVELASARSGLDANAVAHTDEKAPGLFVSGYTPTLSDQLFYAQSDFIRSRVINKESFVIVGRCSNSVLYGYADSLDVFIYAPLHKRIQRVMDFPEYHVGLDKEITADMARKEIKRHDKARLTYYQYYSEFRWGRKEGYDILIDSSLLGIDGTVDMLAEIAEKQFGS